MKLFERSVFVPHPWSFVSFASWRKYPNDKSPQVLHVDILSRSVCPETGILRTERLITCKQNLPSIVEWVIILIIIISFMIFSFFSFFSLQFLFFFFAKSFIIFLFLFFLKNKIKQNKFYCSKYSLINFLLFVIIIVHWKKQCSSYQRSF